MDVSIRIPQDVYLQVDRDCIVHGILRRRRLNGSIHFCSTMRLPSRTRWRKNVLRQCSNPPNRQESRDGQPTATSRGLCSPTLPLKRKSIALGVDERADILRPRLGSRMDAKAADQTPCAQSSKGLASAMTVCKVGGSSSSSSSSSKCFNTIHLDSPLLPLRRRSSAMKLAGTRRWRRWKGDVLGKPPEPGFETRGDSANITFRRHQRKRVRHTRPLLFGVGVPGWSACIVSFLGASPAFARPLASVDREASAVLLRDAQQVCAELRPQVRALARASAWRTREEFELAYTRNLVGVLAALVPLEWRRQQRLSTEKRAGLLMEVASEVNRARLCRVQRLLDTLASSLNQRQGLPIDAPR